MYTRFRSASIRGGDEVLTFDKVDDSSFGVFRRRLRCERSSFLFCFRDVKPETKAILPISII